MRLERFVVHSVHTSAQAQSASSKTASEPLPNKGLARELLLAGEVLVNGQVVKEPGWQVFLGNGVVCDQVRIRGEMSSIPQVHRLFVLHKPAGMTGELKREERTHFCGSEAVSLADLVPEQWWSQDLCMFGRLDKPTTGLCILGRRECAGVGSLLLHPQHHVTKSYLVHLAHNNPLSHGGGDGLVPDACQRFAEGILLSDGSRCEPASLQVLLTLGSCTCARRLVAFRQRAPLVGSVPSETPETAELAHGTAGEGAASITDSHSDESGCAAYTTVRVKIREGKFHQIKRMLATVGGYGVHRLHRESFGALSLECMGLPEGAMRPMTNEEYALVQDMLPSRMCPERERSNRWRDEAPIVA